MGACGSPTEIDAARTQALGGPGAEPPPDDPNAWVVRLDPGLRSDRHALPQRRMSADLGFVPSRAAA